MILEKYNIYRTLKTAKAIQTRSFLRFTAFCILTLCNKSRLKLFHEKAFQLDINGKLFELRIGKSEFDFLYETNIQCVYQSLFDFVPKSSQLAIDVGANIGSASLQWHRTLTDGTIYAIEPHPNTFQRLLKNIRINQAENVIKPFNLALGSSDGEMTLFVSEDSSMAMKNRSSKCEGHPIDVPCLTLDTFVQKQQIDHIDLLKIDVEGFEADVLAGAVQSLQDTSKVVFEYHSDTLKKHCSKVLKDAGFHLTTKGKLVFGRKNQATVG